MSEESHPPLRRLVLAIFDDVSGDKQQVTLNESVEDTSEEKIIELVRALRLSAPRVDNVVPFTTE